MLCAILQCTEMISIHAPREGGDAALKEDTGQDYGISIHAPREGGDINSMRAANPAINFNPRPPRGGRQRFGELKRTRFIHFNPRPPRGGRQDNVEITVKMTVISIHAPREGGDPKSRPRSTKTKPFQSTPPARGATARVLTVTSA